ncbi:Zinc finger DNA binding protein [Operophtera brumata]|uniref:Zinc finger DNA binding protein n=1 Tax=Operophtera brumata TaxID=104452 RepID=A0A0L7L9T9_OPEBR|nr:Zinc finger DNA binding protein [Operophtera brumata]
MVKCAACAKFMSVNDGVKCPKCASASHRECVGLSVGAVISGKWRCGLCRPVTPRARDPATPIQDNLCTASGSPVCEPTDGVTQGIIAEMRSQFIDMKAELTKEFKSFKTEMRELRSSVYELKSNIAGIRTDLIISINNVTAIETRMTELENAFKMNDFGTVSKLEQTVSDLKTTLNDREQESLLNDVEITGLPEQKGENLANLIPFIASRMDMPLDERDIVSVERVGATKISQEESTSTGTMRPRRVVFRFTRRTTRDALLQKARERRGLTSAELGLEGAPLRVFFNERLTRLNRLLSAKAREECRLHNWRYCWTKGGRIYLRKEHGLSAFRIHSNDELQAVFQTN